MINEDRRGLFVELYRKSEIDMEFRQISYLTMNEGCWRGGHYHEVNSESFILLEGDCKMLKEYENGVCVTIDMKTFQCYGTYPKEKHTLFSRSGAKILCLSSVEFDQENTDTFIKFKNNENTNNNSNEK